MKYKIEAFDEVKDIYLLYRRSLWFFWSFVSCGGKEKLTQWVKSNGGIL